MVIIIIRIIVMVIVMVVVKAYAMRDQSHATHPNISLLGNWKKWYAHSIATYQVEEPYFVYQYV